MTRLRWNRIPQHVERAVLELAKMSPALGRVRAAKELNTRGLGVTESTVRSVWKRYGLETSEKRSAASAREAEQHIPAIAIATPCFQPVTAGRMSESFVFSLAALLALGADDASSQGTDSSHTFSDDDGGFVLSESANDISHEGISIDHAGLASESDWMLV